MSSWLLVHGGGMTGRFWDRLVPHLDGAVLAPDMPARRGKAGDLATQSVEDEVASILADVETADLPAPIVLVAHSSGGLTVPGIVEVNTIGGFEKQFHVLPDPTRLMAYKLSFRDVMTALAANNANVGAGYIEHNGEQYLVRTPGQVANLDEIREIVIGTRQGVPVRIADVAEVSEGKELRSGAATMNGEETVVGTAMLLMGENSRTAVQQIAAVWHGAMGIVMIVVIIAHIYIGTVGMEGAFEAMGKGDVDLNWAREHHDLWVDEMERRGEVRSIAE